MATYIRSRPPRRKMNLNFVRSGFFLVLALLLAGLAIVFFLLFEMESPALTFVKEPKFLGGRIELPLEVKDGKSGIRSLRVQLSQGTKEEILFEKSFPRESWFGQAGPKEVRETVVIEPRKLGLSEGEAHLRIEARDFSIAGFFKGNLTERVLPVTIDTTAPGIVVLHNQAVIRPGQSGIVAYRISELAARHGMRIDERVFPGFATETPDVYVAYFALPWNAKGFQSAMLFAVDEAGNEGQTPSRTVYKKGVDKFDKLTISDSFLSRKIPEFEQHYPELKGTAIEKYLYVNNIVRLRNDHLIKEVCATSEPAQLWSDRFLRMPGAGRAGFADQRTYSYNGAVVDWQTHLGVDIASLAQAEVRAANRGKVVFADYLGIYGNMVIIDHGQGVFSLYSHLSRITTSKGLLVAKDEPIGNTGTSGMAGGDHLHFSMLIHGIFVTPVEWWDQHWIDVNIKAALGKR